MKNALIVLVSLAAVMAVFFTSCGSSSTPETSPSATKASTTEETTPSTPEASVVRGGKIYSQTCMPCHQVDGSGVPQLNPPLKNTTYVLGDESRLINIVMNGFSEGVEINGETYANPMPAFGGSLKDEEIADVLTYVRKSFGNKASEISADQVKALRK